MGNLSTRESKRPRKESESPRQLCTFPGCSGVSTRECAPFCSRVCRVRDQLKTMKTAVCDATGCERPALMGSQFCSRNCRFSTEGTDDTDPSTSSSIMWAEIESPSSSPEPEQKSVICAAPECDTLTESTSSKFCSPDCRTEATASRKRARQAEVQRRAAETAEAEARKRAGEAVAKSRTMLAAVVGEKMAEGLLRAVHASVDDSRARVRRVRLLVAALRRNSALRGRVLSGALSVGALARMSEEEMADAQLTRRREHAQQESILSRVITTKRDHLSGGKHVLSDRNDIRNEDSVLIVDSAPSSSAADEIMVSSEAVPSDSIGMVQSSSGLGRHSLQEVSSSYSNQLGSMDETSLNRCLLQLEGQVWSVTASGCNGIKNPGSSSGIRNQGSGGSVSDPDSDSESDSSSDSDSGSESPLIGSDCSKPNEINAQHFLDGNRSTRLSSSFPTEQYYRQKERIAVAELFVESDSGFSVESGIRIYLVPSGLLPGDTVERFLGCQPPEGALWVLVI
eukprot:617948_1